MIHKTISQWEEALVNAKTSDDCDELKTEFFNRYIGDDPNACDDCAKIIMPPMQEIIRKIQEKMDDLAAIEMHQG